MTPEHELMKNRPFTVETPDGEWLLTAPQYIIAEIFHLSDAALDHLIDVCIRDQSVYTLSLGLIIPLPYQEVHIWSVEPWRRFMTEEQAKEAVESEAECVRDDPESFAEMYLDSMSTRAIKNYMKGMEDDYAPRGP